MRKNARGICSVKECGGIHKGKGFCGKHYQAQYIPLDNGPCSECDKPARARGLCSSHYGKLRLSEVREETPFRRKSWDLAHTHHITLEQYIEILYSEQNGLCAVCDEKADTMEGMLETGFWHVDHNHACCPGQYSCGLCVRGILCPPCNSQINRKMEDLVWLQKVINYLNISLES